MDKVSTPTANGAPTSTPRTSADGPRSSATNSPTLSPRTSANNNGSAPSTPRLGPQNFTFVSDPPSSHQHPHSPPPSRPQTSHSMRSNPPLPRAEDVYEILCNHQVLPLDMTLAAVRQFVWRQAGELVMYYRRKRRTEPQADPARH